jgi:hypothetical protein
MRFNGFVFLSLPMLSLEANLGKLPSSQAPFPADFVTVPLSESQLGFGFISSRSREKAGP